MSVNQYSARKLREAKVNSDNHILALREVAEEEAKFKHDAWHRSVSLVAQGNSYTSMKK